LGDDLAVNAQKASGFASSRELPVLYAITKGSLRNKLIILPLAFLLSAFMPWIIVPILMVGGIYLAFEGFEKIYEYLLPHKHATAQQETLTEEQKIQSAVTTDFILSIEIVIIALSSVVDANLVTQISVVSLIAIAATLGVYGLVALIVRLDDMGLKLIDIGIQNKQKYLVKFGEMLVKALTKMIRLLTVVGTLAMVLVAGGIFVHNVSYLHHILHPLPSLVAEFAVGIVIGGIAMGCVALFKKIFSH
jgi:predicted DNA repair protein MutK